MDSYVWFWFRILRILGPDHTEWHLQTGLSTGEWGSSRRHDEGWSLGCVQ